MPPRLILPLLVVAAAPSGCDLSSPTPDAASHDGLPRNTHVVFTVVDSVGLPIRPVRARWRYPVGSLNARSDGADARCLDRGCTRFAVVGPRFGGIDLEVSSWRALPNGCFQGDLAQRRVEVRAPDVAEVVIPLNDHRRICGVYDGGS